MFIPRVGNQQKVQVGKDSNQSVHLYSLISLSFAPEEKLDPRLPIEDSSDYAG